MILQGSFRGSFKGSYAEFSKEVFTVITVVTFSVYNFEIYSVCLYIYAMLVLDDSIAIRCSQKATIRNGKLQRPPARRSHSGRCPGQP